MAGNRFSKFGIEDELSKIYNKKVWLKSGAHLIIEEAEGLTVIDVNTGKYISDKGHEETIYKINIEAAAEAARHIRLRNLVGIIVIDFIDIKNQDLKDEIYEHFTESLKNDKARSVVHPISAFGVMQLTRQRVRESVLKALAEDCPVCQGSGFVKSKETICYEILRKIKLILANSEAKKIHIISSKEIIDNLKKTEGKSFEEISTEHKIEIIYEQSQEYIGDFKITAEN